MGFDVDRKYGGERGWTRHQVSVLEANEVLADVNVQRFDSDPKSTSGQGTPMSTLLRGWMLDGLAANREKSIATALDRVTPDVQRLRELVA
ncbi:MULTISPECIES: hypothetical protein [unclassified Cryobacterium]|uniref:hypothetical protein n=1 Tax=unclassified Cryobacterium TaxID=2649013 RepID=UPI000CE543F3|nr:MULTISPECIES: hypothetical protein [unclassified Cryobacterium]